MDDREIQPFIDSTRHVFGALFLMDATPIADGAAGLRGPVIRATIELGGDMEGGVGLVLPLETARRLHAMLTGAPRGSDTAEACDVAAELTDMIAANGAARFPGRRTRLECAGASLRAGAFPPPDAGAVRVPFACECGPFELEASLAFAGTEGSGER